MQHLCTWWMRLGSILLLLESRSINEKDFQLIPSHLFHFDNSLMKEEKKKKESLLVRITHTGPVIAFHSYPVSEYGSSIKLTNHWTFRILTPWAERKEESRISLATRGGKEKRMWVEERKRMKQRENGANGFSYQLHSALWGLSVKAFTPMSCVSRVH